MALRTSLKYCALGINRNNTRLFRPISGTAYNAKEEAVSKDLPLPQRKDIKELLLSKEEIEYIEKHKRTIAVSDPEDIGLASGIPQEHIHTRRVRIYQPAKSAMQSGTNNIHFWQIDFDTRERWENPLMGWTSSGDPMSNIKVDFATMEEAIEHCKKMRWEYYVQRPNVNDPKPRSYGANFSWNKRTRVSTK
ncbi:hypothetical protein KM043_008689 [Ampulex compressa]|nr:hypothetical protein KM043_008689 [Ampulex compressa]